MKRSETSTVYVRDFEVKGEGPHRTLVMGQEIRVCLDARCGCGDVRMIRIDADRWQIVLKRPEEMWQTYVLVEWG